MVFLRFLCLVIFLIPNFGRAQDLKTVDFVDPGKYLGIWYQMARNPHFFEKGCFCPRQSLSINQDGNVDVYNSCNMGSNSGELSDISGVAYNQDPTTNAKFVVDLGLPQKGDYWIIGLGDNYEYAVVSDPSKRSLYILSKTPSLSEDLYQEAVTKASEQLDTSKLLRQDHTGCTYPLKIKSSNKLIETDNKSHPGSKQYDYSFEVKKLTCDDRQVSVYLPTNPNHIGKFPAVIYGHGQATGEDKYAATFEHLAKKGVAVIFPMYDSGFFDKNWKRMGEDYVKVSDCAISQSGEVIDRNNLVFSGHSKGAYVASVATGLAIKNNMSLKPKAAIIFQTAGVDEELAKSITVPLTIVFSDREKTVSLTNTEKLFDLAPSTKKQIITIKSYPATEKSKEIVADHMWPLTKPTFFGGGEESMLHYYGSWKWLTAAALDLNEFIYGEQTGYKGLPELFDDIKKNW